MNAAVYAELCRGFYYLDHACTTKKTRDAL
jgi:hypothetical protein